MAFEAQWPWGFVAILLAYGAVSVALPGLVSGFGGTGYPQWASRVLARVFGVFCIVAGAAIAIFEIVRR